MRRDRLFVAEMIDACDRIVALTADRETSAIDADTTVREALLWNFTVLGEASNQLSAETRDAHPEIAWRRAAALRNRIVHGYFSTDTDVLTSTAREGVPEMRAQLVRLLPQLADGA